MITSIKNINIKEIEQDIAICYKENNPIILANLLLYTK